MKRYLLFACLLFTFVPGLIRAQAQLSLNTNIVTITSSGQQPAILNLFNGSVGGNNWGMLSEGYGASVPGTLGFYNSSTNTTPFAFTGAGSVSLNANGVLGWSNNPIYADAGGNDTWLSRPSAGSLQVNGASGLGRLITGSLTVGGVDLASSLGGNVKTNTTAAQSVQGALNVQSLQIAGGPVINVTATNPNGLTCATVGIGSLLFFPTAGTGIPPVYVCSH